LDGAYCLGDHNPIIDYPHDTGHFPAMWRRNIVEMPINPTPFLRPTPTLIARNAEAIAIRCALYMVWITHAMMLKERLSSSRSMGIRRKNAPTTPLLYCGS
jgi:hypothetical protein